MFFRLPVRKFFRELRVIMISIVASMGSLLWAVVMLVLIEYVFAMVFMNATVGYLMDHPGEEGDADVKGRLLHYWSTVYRSMLSLHRAISGGEDWGDVGEALKAVGEHYYIVFLFFVSFIIFAVLNILTGIFLEQAVKVSERDHSTIAHETKEQEQEDLHDLKSLFREVDVDDSGTITLNEFTNSLQNSNVNTYLKKLNIDFTDAVGFFKAVQSESEAAVDISAFMDSCIRLKGPAKRADLEIMSWRLKQMHRQTLYLATQLEALQPGRSELNDARASG